ncbi:MAG: chorismate synthase [Lachnospiraceae bacterium]|nr:chorismate synthase [Lachnospiraceae bacterium]
MAGSIFGNLFRISTWGESHGKGVGVVVDGCPAGLSLSEDDIQKYLNRRKPGQSKFTTPRSEDDAVEILSGVFEGKTTGTPISMIVYNKTQRSSDYSEIAGYYRPGHADYTFDEKYGFRDYRGGGRSSARETIARVAAGAIAAKLLAEFGISVTAYTQSIADVEISADNFDIAERDNNPVDMPDANAAAMAQKLLEEKMSEKDSVGGVVECVVKGMPTGVGEPVFDKLDAKLGQAIMSIGAVKGFEVGSGFEATKMTGYQHNDNFVADADGHISKKSNNAGGILGCITDGSDIIIRAAFKPTPSIFKSQETVNKAHENIAVEIKGRHDPIVVPRVVVVVKAMTALTILDMLMMSMTSTVDKMKKIFL